MGNASSFAISSPSLLLNPIIGSHPPTYRDLTVVAQIFSENIVIAVRADSSIRSGRDLVERLRKEPATLSIAVSTALDGANHLAAALLMTKADIDPKNGNFIEVPLFRKAEDSEFISRIIIAVVYCASRLGNYAELPQP